MRTTKIDEKINCSKDFSEDKLFDGGTLTKESASASGVRERRRRESMQFFAVATPKPSIVSSAKLNYVTLCGGESFSDEKNTGKKRNDVVAGRKDVWLVLYECEIL